MPGSSSRRTREPLDGLRIARREGSGAGLRVLVYPRDLAVTEGLLVDVSEAARGAGLPIGMEVFLTRWVFEDWVRWRPNGEGPGLEDDEPARLDRLLRAAARAIDGAGASSSVECERGFRIEVREQDGVARIGRLKVVVEPEGEGGRVATVLEPGEE